MLFLGERFPPQQHINSCDWIEDFTPVKTYRVPNFLVKFGNHWFRISKCFFNTILFAKGADAVLCESSQGNEGCILPEVGLVPEDVEAPEEPYDGGGADGLVHVLL